MGSCWFDVAAKLMLAGIKVNITNLTSDDRTKNVQRIEMTHSLIGIAQDDFLKHIGSESPFGQC
jgi:hypothetical protein